MNIGQAAKQSGISAKMIRHYESVGLLTPANRGDSGYRQFSDNDVHVLKFIRRSRDLGFSIEQIGSLISLWQDSSRTSREVKALAKEHLQFLDQKLQEIEGMRQTLMHLVNCCHGDERPDCPILGELEGHRH